LVLDTASLGSCGFRKFIITGVVSPFIQFLETASSRGSKVPRFRTVFDDRGSQPVYSVFRNCVVWRCTSIAVSDGLISPNRWADSCGFFKPCEFAVFNTTVVDGFEGLFFPWVVVVQFAYQS